MMLFPIFFNYSSVSLGLHACNIDGKLQYTLKVVTHLQNIVDRLEKYKVTIHDGKLRNC